MKEVNYDRILKECFWDYNLTKEDIKRLAHSSNVKEREFLFQKILLNSTSLFQDIKVFDTDILKNMIENYRVPIFNQKYIQKRKNMLEVYFLDKPLTVNELKWVA